MSTQALGEPQSFQPTLPDAECQIDQLHGIADSTPVAAADPAYASRPASWVRVDFMQACGWYADDASAFAGHQLASGPVEQLQVVGVGDLHRRLQYAHDRPESVADDVWSLACMCHAYRHAGVRAVFEAPCHVGADWIQVDIGHRRQQCALVAQALGLEAALPKTALAGVFPVGTAGDGLGQATHQPRQVGQTASDQLQALGVGQQASTLHIDRLVDIVPGTKQAHPTGGDILVAPAGRGPGRKLHDQMQMIAHDRVGVDGDGEALRQETQPLFDPVLAVLERPSGVAVEPAQEGATDTALGAVIESVGTGLNELCAGLGHAAKMSPALGEICRENSRRAVGIF